MWMKQSTAVTLRFGPFVDSTDGDTEETALSLVAADVKLSKNGATIAAKNDSTAPTHDANGWYSVALNATDTNTLGRILVYVHVSGALYAWREFTVLPANVFDSLVSGSDNLQVDATEWAGSATAATHTAVATAPTNFADLSVQVSTGEVNVNMGQTTPGSPTADTVGEALRNAHQSLPLDTAPAASGGLPTVGTGAGQINPDGAGNVPADVVEINGVAEAAQDLQASAQTIVRGTVDTAGFAPTTTEFEADDITEATADHFNGRVIIFTSGALKDQATDITDYSLVTARGHFTVTAMTEAPANNDTFIIV